MHVGFCGVQSCIAKWHKMYCGVRRESGDRHLFSDMPVWYTLVMLSSKVNGPVD